LKRSEAQTGATPLIQRFGSAANLNIHLHCLVLDGVYRIQNGVPRFYSVRKPADLQLQALLNQIIKRIMKALTRNGALIGEELLS
jgi:Putative transposase